MRAPGLISARKCLVNAALAEGQQIRRRATGQAALLTPCTSHDAGAFQGYQESVHRLREVRSRDRATEYDKTEVMSWHMTRLNTIKGTCFSDIPEYRSVKGSGAFGKVYAATDRVSGYEFAIKVIHLQLYHNPEEAQVLVHREIKILTRLSHVSDINPPPPPIVTVMLTKRQETYYRMSRLPTLRHSQPRDLYALERRVLEIAHHGQKLSRL